MPLSQAQLAALAEACQAALPSEQKQDVPMELTIPQWAEESGWGAHQPGLNPFGIKATPGEAYVQKLTKEFVNGQPVYIEQNFEAFPTLADAFVRHAQLITAGTYFKAAFAQYEQDRDVPALVRNIARHYSTAPTYADQILEIGRMPAVQDAIRAVRTGKEFS